MMIKVEATPYICYHISFEADRRMPELEPIILQDAYYGYCYARNVIRDRWLELEAKLMKDSPFWAYSYAEEILKRRWPEAENTILVYEFAASRYAQMVLKARWPELEAVFTKGSALDDYEAFFKCKLEVKQDVTSSN